MSGSLTLGASAVTVGGLYQHSQTKVSVGSRLTVSNGSYFVVYAGSTNAQYEHGAIVEVSGDTVVWDESWVVPHSQPTNGGSAVFRLADLTVGPTNTAGFEAKTKGFERLYGHGVGQHAGGRGTGGGYGGKGGDIGGNPGGIVYGWTNAPIHCGSGGGYNNTSYDAGWGGGLIRIEAADVVMDGMINVDGENTGGRPAPGSGGGIFIVCESFSGNENGVLSANGGIDDDAGYGSSGGGGGRIAVWYGVSSDQKETLLTDPDNAASLYASVEISDTYDGFSTNVFVRGGTAADPDSDDGDPGTAIFLTVPPPRGTILIIR